VFLPDGVVTNERISKLMDTNDDWIQQRTGIRERRYARKGTSSVDLGVEAAKAALADAGLEPGDVDLILFATMTPAHYFPGNGGIAAMGTLGTPVALTAITFVVGLIIIPFATETRGKSLPE